MMGLFSKADFMLGSISSTALDKNLCYKREVPIYASNSDVNGVLNIAS